MKIPYTTPSTSKPPSPGSQLGMIVRALKRQEWTSRNEVFNRAFNPGDNEESFKTIVYTAKKRGYVEAERPGSGKNRYRLTDKGLRIQEAING